MNFIAHYLGEHDPEDYPTVYCDGVFRTCRVSAASAYCILGYTKYPPKPYNENDEFIDTDVNFVACNDRYLVIKGCFEL